MILNDSQLCAIRHTEGPMLVLAGPGSGKTTVIITRIRELISSHDVQPGQILAVTFSRASANEMKDRYRQTAAATVGSPEFATFHSIFLKILKEYTGPLCPSLISDREKYTFFRSELESLFPSGDNIADMTEEFASAISRIKSNTSPYETDDRFLKILYTRYEDFLSSGHLMDFDDIISNCLKLFRNRPEILEKCRRRYRYILIDEFQDISPIQYETVKLLAGRSCNIFAVGDDDQSIYGFRGAAPGMLKRFIREHPRIRQISLNINYRCPESILHVSEKLIFRNLDRIEKKQISYSAGESRGPAYCLKEFPSRNAEYECIIGIIKSIISAGGDICAVLFRNNMDSALFVKMLQDVNLPYELKGVQKSFFEHFAVKDLISYLRSALYFRKEDLIRIINRPSRYISRNALTGNSGSDIFQSIVNYYRGNRRMQPQIRNFRMQLEALAELPPYSAVKYIRKAMGYENWLKEFAREHQTDLSEYEKILESFEEYVSGFSSIEALLGSIEEQSDYNSGRGMHSEGSAASMHLQIQIMTMHSAKGLEFDHVFIPDANEGVIPSVKSVRTGNIEEERRLFYVAMTRARKTLMISWSSHLHNKKAAPSIFVSDILR